MTVGRAMSGAMIASPLAIPNCVGWYDASDASTITKSGNDVTGWNDKSGSGFNLASAEGAYPTYTSTQNSKHVVTYSGSQYLNNGSATVLQGVSGWSAFAVGICTNFSASGVFVGVNTPSGTTRASLSINSSGYPSTGGRRANTDSFGYTAGNSAVSTSAYYQFSVVGSFSASTLTLFQNGLQIAQNTSWLSSGTTPNDGGAIGVGCLNVTSGFLTGSIGEVIVYGRALSDVSRIAVEKYLRSKWATG